LTQDFVVNADPILKWFPSAEFDTEEFVWTVSLRKDLHAEIQVLVDLGGIRTHVDVLGCGEISMDYSAWFMLLEDDLGNDKELDITMSQYMSAYDWASQQSEGSFYDEEDLRSLATFINLLWTSIFTQKVRDCGPELAILLSGFEVFNHGLD